MKKLFFFFLLCVSINAQTATAPVGDGSAGNPYQIATLENLYWIAVQVNNSSSPNTFSGKFFIQTADIDAAATGSGGVWGTTGWIPIGYVASYSSLDPVYFFSGNYNGQNHTISNLYINREDDMCYIGLWGYLSNATIENLNVTNISISCSNNYAQYVGAIAGYSFDNCTITNCNSSGSITGGEYVGGLIGFNGDGNNVALPNTIDNCHTSCNVTATLDSPGGFISFSCNGTISNSYSTGTVLSPSFYAGGFISYNTSAITKCYSTSNVTGNADQFHGGFIGYNLGNISDCYATGSVTSSGQDVGGFIGYHNVGAISNCYSAGLVAGVSNVGGFIGYNFDFTKANVSSCYWDTQTSNQASSPGGGTGKTTAEMKTQSTFTSASWDFTTIWEMIGTNYPRLKSIPDAALPVELSSFTVEITGNVIKLNWQTATEVSNYGFEIEKIRN